MSSRPRFACCCLLRLFTGRDPGIQSTLRTAERKKTHKNLKWVKITTSNLGGGSGDGGKGNGSLVLLLLFLFLIKKKIQTAISPRLSGANYIVGERQQSNGPPL